MKKSSACSCRTLVWTFALILAVLHQDFWLWNDKTLVFGFLPSGLAYHAWYSIAAAALWALAVRYAWPHEVEQWAESAEEKTDG